MRHDLLGLTADACAAMCRASVGHADRFHRATYRHLMATGRWDPAAVETWHEAERSCPGVIARVQALGARDQLPVEDGRTTAHDPERGTTIKLRLRLADGALVETVLVPMGGFDGDDGDAADRYTVCVSSQVGCKMGCTFCHTAAMGLVRHLAAHEIVGQILAAQAAINGLGRQVRNVVFMGMGEPLDNAEAVGTAVAVLTDRAGLSIAHHHITVSTVGRVDVLPRLTEVGLGRVNLAVSLSAADDALRDVLMPVNRIFPIAQLKAALLALPLARDRRILVSYVVIPGVNDGDDQIDSLAAWCDGLRVLVNLIPFNPIPGRTWRAPTADEVYAVRDLLDQRGIPVRLRRTKGEAVMAACGQLASGATRRRPQPAV